MGRGGSASVTTARAGDAWCAFRRRPLSPSRALFGPVSVKLPASNCRPDKEMDSEPRPHPEGLHGAHAMHGRNQAPCWSRLHGAVHAGVPGSEEPERGDQMRTWGSNDHGPANVCASGVCCAINPSGAYGERRMHSEKGRVFRGCVGWLQCLPKMCRRVQGTCKLQVCALDFGSV